jgi:hypothetical protein
MANKKDVSVVEVEIAKLIKDGYTEVTATSTSYPDYIKSEMIVTASPVNKKFACHAAVCTGENSLLNLRKYLENSEQGKRLIKDYKSLDGAIAFFLERGLRQDAKNDVREEILQGPKLLDRAGMKKLNSIDLSSEKGKILEAKIAELLASLA